jgi:hypothetical protein
MHNQSQTRKKSKISLSQTSKEKGIEEEIRKSGIKFSTLSNPIVQKRRHSKDAVFYDPDITIEDYAFENMKDF